MKRTRVQNSVHGALILLTATAAAKLIGALFKIPLCQLIGGIGMGYYMSAYELYIPVYTIAMAGLPIAVSKLVSAAAGEGRWRDVKSYLRVSKRAFLITGLSGFFVLALIAYPFSAYISKDIGTVYPITVIAPSMLFCCLSACCRGYFEGLRNMYPTGISQVLEALCKLLFGYAAALMIIKLGIGEYNSTATLFGKAVQGDVYTALLPYAAAGAVSGVTVGSAVGAVYMFVRCRGNDGISAYMLQNAPAARSDRQNMKTLVCFALPVVLGAAAQNAAGLVDLATVPWQLTAAVEHSSALLFSQYGSALAELDAAGATTFLYGCYKGFAYPFYNLVPTITAVIGVSALPNLSAAWARRDHSAVNADVESVLRMTAVLALPAGLGLSALGLPVLNTLYYTQPMEVAVSAPQMLTLGIAAAAAGLAMPVTSMLQAIDKQAIPVINLAIGVFVKLVLNVVLIRQPSINILGAAYSTLGCYLVVLLLDLAALYRYSKAPPKIWSTLVNPMLAAITCAAGSWLVFQQLYEYFSRLERVGNLLVTVICAAVGGIIYLIMLIFLKTIKKNDIKLLPKGEKLTFILEKFKVIG